MTLTERERAAPPALRFFDAQVEHMRNEFGVNDEILAEVAVKARAHATNNPNAIFRKPLTVEQVLAEAPVFGRLRKLYACPPSCGAAAVIVCSSRFAARHGIAERVAIRALVTVSDSAVDLDHPNVLDALGREATRRAAHHAYELAGVGPEDIDVAEVHDCFVSNELIACSSLGFCDEDELPVFVSEGRNSYGGDVVVGPSGGLLGKGHPLGATGLAQIAELTWQLRGQAGGQQVERARIGLQHNLGLGSSLSVTILQAC
jgi:acetyl-CoA C-acetyltransferase